MSEALKLAEALDSESIAGRVSNQTGRKAAIELRRLAAVEQELEALKRAISEAQPEAWTRWGWNRTGQKSLVFEKPTELSLAEEATGVIYEPLYTLKGIK